MTLRVTVAGAGFVFVLVFQALLVLPFVILGDWDTARLYATPLIALLGGWTLKGWHDDALRRRGEEGRA